MTTWRERIQAARENGGKFTTESRELYTNRGSCLAAEVAAQYGVEYVGDALRSRYDDACVTRPGWFVLWALGDRAAAGIHGADPALVEKTLDAIEDRALALKREFRDGDGVSPEPSDGGGPS